MAKTQTSTRTFTKTINGEKVNQVAYSAADVVRYQFDGWREITEPIELSTAASAKPETGKK